MALGGFMAVVRAAVVIGAVAVGALTRRSGSFNTPGSFCISALIIMDVP